MPAPAFCSVCEHPDRAEIDVALKGGTSVRQICNAFDGVGRTAVGNHLLRCTTSAKTRQRRIAAKGGRKVRAPLTVAAAPKLKSIESAADVVEDLQLLRRESFDLFERAKERRDWKSAERIFGQVVSVVDRFGEMHKVLGAKGGMTVNIDASSRRLEIALKSLSDAELESALAALASGQMPNIPGLTDTIEGEVSP